MWRLGSFSEDDAGFFGCERIIVWHSDYFLGIDCFDDLFLRYLAKRMDMTNKIAEYTRVMRSIVIPESEKFSIP